jgi:bisphosphoglycerate-independent phosphoglycerate mutase (AlkP superfamily)
MVEAAKNAGSYMVITSDHGNIEDDTSAHSVNDVLTTIIRPDGAELVVGIPVYQARLFDVAPTVLELIGASQVRKDAAPSAPPERFVGRPLVATG